MGVPAVETVGVWPPQPDVEAWDAIVHSLREEAQAELDRAIEDLDVPATGDVVYGGVGDELVRLSHDVDLMVCGSRGWGTVRRVLLGSTSDRLVRHAACPVAVAPRPETPLL